MEGFGDLFSKSWKEYKSSFGLFFKIFLLFSLIPSSILLVLTTFSILVGSPDIIGNLNATLVSFIPLFISFLVVLFLSIVMYISFIYISVHKEAYPKMTLSHVLKGSFSYFWSYIGLALLMFILLVPLYVLFIIPGIIFSVYWSFSIFVLMRENTSIWQSMKRSKLIIKGRWWKVFGYSILIGLIMFLISAVFSAPRKIFSFINLFTSLSGLGYSILIILLGIIALFSGLITTPLSMLFFKNFYLNLRTNPRKV